MPSTINISLVESPFLFGGELLQGRAHVWFISVLTVVLSLAQALSQQHLLWGCPGAVMVWGWWLWVRAEADVS